MIQIGRTSVWYTGSVIRCESYTGDVHGNATVKQKLISINKVSENKISLETNKGTGYIQFNESSNGNFTVELVLPKFFGNHRFYGGSSSAQVKALLSQLNEL